LTLTLFWLPIGVTAQMPPSWPAVVAEQIGGWTSSGDGSAAIAGCNAKFKAPQRIHAPRIQFPFAARDGQP
jgi:hypothetical protein